MTRQRCGKPSSDRPIPERVEASTSFHYPDRLMRDHRLSAAARLVAAAVAAEARRGEVAAAPSNDRLADLVGLTPRRVQAALVALEWAGWIYRLHAGDELALDSLRWAGYADPWIAAGKPRPARALVLLWRLREPDPASREAGPAPRHRTRPRGEGARP